MDYRSKAQTKAQQKLKPITLIKPQTITIAQSKQSNLLLNDKNNEFCLNTSQ
jgi:hypothetical protein